ncbi:hypothetical protein F5887DRAFT_565748 [Amanita rubescens]|nr:hypothetical protein F5887DRAFT_565748 [Amanita rubescens]
MKFLSVILLLAFPILSLAQAVTIESPPAGASITQAGSFTVQIARPDTLTGSIEVSVAIGVTSCVSTPCPGFTADQDLGDVLYYGPYTPELYNGRTPEYENFTVSLPSGFPLGAAQINVAHFSLLGVSSYLLE